MGDHRGDHRMMDVLLQPGMLVRHPDCPDWGVGQVQSSIGFRVTVNFENAGKVVINARKVTLRPLWDE